jgi:hypothetical protein
MTDMIRQFDMTNFVASGSGYISLSDLRPLRGIYSYPVFSALHSSSNPHETNTY